jgi:hypothetical protein
LRKEHFDAVALEASGDDISDGLFVHNSPSWATHFWTPR